MKIPLLDLSKEYDFLKKDIHREINRCFKDQQWILGPAVKAFEGAAAKYLGVKYTIGVSSGTEALILALIALGLKRSGKSSFDKKDEIITTPFTFIATAEAIIRSGATPVFVDIDPDTFNIDPAKIAKAINKNTVGIIPVHLYGLAANMTEVLKIAKLKGLFIVEDAAQSFGAKFKDRRLGTLADAGAFSFFPSKNLGAYGDGGLISTNNASLAKTLKVLRNHGQLKAHDAEFTGYNSRLDSIQAAVLGAKLKYIDRFNRARRRIAKQYNRALKDIKQISIPVEPAYCYHVYHLYSIKVSSSRDKLLKYLNRQGIAARAYYPVSLARMKAFKCGKIKGTLKNTQAVCNKILSLPIHPFLRANQAGYITQKISKFFG